MAGGHVAGRVSVTWRRGEQGCILRRSAASPARLVGQRGEDCAGGHAQISGIMLEIQSRDAPAAPAGLKGARMRMGRRRQGSRVESLQPKSGAGKRGGFGGDGDARAGNRGAGAGARRDTKNK